MHILQCDMLDSVDREDRCPVTELYGGKRGCRKVISTHIRAS
jgi:hypothetical protein